MYINDQNRKYKEKVIKEINRRQMISYMNNTKWTELRKGIGELLFPPPFEMKYVLEESQDSRFNSDVCYWGDWSEETMRPYYAIEWVKVRPRYIKKIGKYVEDQIIDETKDFIALLHKFNIFYHEQDGAFLIYGYRCASDRNIN
ncbi:hypothetical protein SH1V18_38210 [Vallitalea longa]|uniref:Uncharacterized protein n=2 Tax=Vallitalea longa TaxID=2936439 RepID=A0A9W5YES0_9FIRM|nr:hypothetical protein SH1V18_38210 [Vallitalea longa]